MSMGLVDALASGGAAARGAHQREVDEAAIVANKQATELQGLQLATGKMQLQEAQNQQTLQKALEQGYKEWTDGQIGASDRDAVARKQYELDATTYAGKVGDASNWQGNKSIGLGDVGPAPKEPEPIKQGRASLFSHLAEIAARTPGGMKAAEELRKSHKMAEDEGMLEATKFALRGDDPEKVIAAFNEYGTNKLIPGSGRVENGVYYAQGRDGKMVDLDPKKWGVVFGLIKPDEYKIEGGYRINTRTGETVQLAGQPKDYFLTLKDAEGGERLVDLRKPDAIASALPPTIGKKDREEFQAQINKNYGPSTIEAMTGEQRGSVSKAIQAGMNLLAAGATNAQGRKLTGMEVAGIVSDLVDGRITEDTVRGMMPKQTPAAATPGNPSVDGASFKTIDDLDKAYPGAKATLLANANNAAAIDEFDRVFGPGTAARLLGPRSTGAGVQPSGAFSRPLPNQSDPDAAASALPSPMARPTPAPAPKLDAAKLASYKPGELAYFASRKDLPEADQRAVVQEAERRGMRATKNLTGGYTLKEVVGQPPKPAAPPAPSDVPGLQSAPPIAPAPTAGPAAAPKPAAPAPKTNRKKSSGLGDARDEYQRNRKDAGRKPTENQDPAPTATEVARKQASKDAAGRLHSGDIQWFLDNWDLLEPGTQKIYADAINRKLQQGPMGKFPKGSRFNANTR